eukprot:scaffold92032_cov42-Attheya_sp.AAC.1
MWAIDVASSCGWNPHRLFGIREMRSNDASRPCGLNAVSWSILFGLSPYLEYVLDDGNQGVVRLTRIVCGGQTLSKASIPVAYSLIAGASLG